MRLVGGAPLLYGRIRLYPHELSAARNLHALLPSRTELHTAAIISPLCTGVRPAVRHRCRLGTPERIRTVACAGRVVWFVHARSWPPASALQVCVRRRPDEQNANVLRYVAMTHLETQFRGSMLNKVRTPRDSRERWHRALYWQRRRAWEGGAGEPRGAGR